MDAAVEGIVAQEVSFTGADGNTLCGTSTSLPANDQGTGDRGTVLLLHGGGQTRHSWQATARMLAAAGWRAITIDQRGHGDSDWVANGDYSLNAYANDLCAVAKQLISEDGALPVVIGASLGGLAGLLTAGGGNAALLRALVLVDITPHMKADGVERILGFMGASAREGFASLQDAADAIAEYLPHRPRPASLDGLAKNLRCGDDGRYRWHWDPEFLTSRKDARSHARETEARLLAATRDISLPVLLVRGRESELVGEDEARRFGELVPHAKLSDVTGARHMVAGDRNDVFTAAVVGFLDEL